CSAPLSAIVYGDNKSESKQDAKDGAKIELDASESSSTETSQPANAEKNLLLATRPRSVLSRSLAPPAVENPKPEAEKPSANILNTSAPQLSNDQSRPGSLSLYFMSEYRRDEIKYTGKPSLTLQFPGPVPPFSVPDAPIFFVPSAFEPNDEQFVGYASANIKDFGFERLRFDANVSFRYSADLDDTTEASPF